MTLVEDRKSQSTNDIVRASLRRRQATERRFRILGLGAVLLALVAIGALFTSIAAKGYKAFQQSHIVLDVFLDPEILDPTGARNPADLRIANTNSVIRDALRKRFPDVSGRNGQRDLYRLVSGGAPFLLGEMLAENPELVGQTIEVEVLANDDIDMLLKGYIRRDVPEAQRRVNNRQIAWVDELSNSGQIRKLLNVYFFTRGDSRDPEVAGILGALVGSVLTLLVTLVIAFPVGAAAAVYLEEFAPKNRFTAIIELNINNLAAVPSIVFGLLGLAVFLNFFGLPRSAPVVGGMCLSLMTLPTVIIASRAALKGVPPSVREAALGIGASKIQTVFHHVLPLAFPGILTGTIIGMAQALGETAPLLMIGMVAFIVDIPSGFTDAATALPVQIFLWADAPERAFVERTSAATMVLLGFLFLMNAVAVYLRKRFETKY